VPANFIFTKIIATVGPATGSVEVLVRLIEEGARVFRINFSHGAMEDFDRLLEAVRAAEAQTGQPVAVLGDLCGPKIRLGQVAGEGIGLEVGQRVHFQRDSIIAEARGDGPVTFSTNWPTLVDEVQPGQRMLIDDGAVRMLVIEVIGEGLARQVVCSVTHGGRVSTRKGVNLPDTDIQAPSLTDYDRQCCDWAVRRELDYLALSFVRRAADVQGLTAYLKTRARPGEMTIPIITKIEKPQALDDLEAIVHVSDAVMVARGDLGVEMDLAQVPVIQKLIVSLCRDYGTPVIVATQMLQSMMNEPAPTRAEVSDVANAIFDGADAVMLSGETAVGRFAVQTVHTMAHIAAATEAHMRQSEEAWDHPPRKLRETRYRTAALAHGVSVVVRDLDAKLVITWSQLAGGARYLSQNRLHVPIIAASSSPAAMRRMGLLFGVYPIAMQPPAHSENFVTMMDRIILERGWAQRGDAIVFVKGEPLGISGVTNKLRIHYVGDASGTAGPAT